jgi:serine protease AprX
VADDFEERLRGADASRELAVIVTGLGVVAAERAVGRFDLTRRLGLIHGFAATMTAGQARALARTPGVRRVEADGRVRALDDATDLDFGAAQARADTPGLDGSGVGICVIDTGIDPAHEQFAGRPVTFTDLVNGRAAPYDDHGHGTHVAAIAAGDGTGGAEAATFNGVAPAAELYVAKVLDSRGFGADSDVAAAVEWCHQQPGVDVISMSLGSDGGDGTDAVSLAVDRAAGEGDVVVVAAGNSGDEPGTISSPGVAKGALTVAAVSDHSAPPGTDWRDNGIWLAAFSSRGPTVDGRTKPDVAAPGVTVRAARAGTTAGYVTYSGTSMATPYVAGAVALAREAAPSASPATIRSALMSTAVDVGAAGSDNEWGAGLVDVRALVDAVRGLSPVRRTAFPARQHLTGAVPTNGYVDIPVDIGSGDLGVPIAVTMTAGGEAICYYSCLIVEWSPDLDLRLTDPSGTVVARSECALSGVSCGIGRQETIGFRPTVTGRHTLRVYAFTGNPNNGEGGSFEVDLLRGPLEGAVVEPPPAPNVSPVADAGPDQTVRAKGKTRRASVTLDASGSTDPDGTIVRHEWRRGTEVVGTTARVTLSLPVGTYTYTVQVTDDDGAVDDDSVTVVVR